MEEILAQWERQQVQWEVGEGMEILQEERELERAELYWKERRLKVWYVSMNIGLQDLHNEVEDETCFQQFLYDLFEYGEYEPSMGEIATELRMFLTGHFGLRRVIKGMYDELKDYVARLIKRSA